MKYVLLGNLSPEWASKQSERLGKAKAKLDKLGIKIESSTTRRATTISSTSSMPRIRRRCSRSPSGTRPMVWGGSKVCRPSTQRASKPRSRTQRAKRRCGGSQLSCPPRVPLRLHEPGAAFFPGAMVRSAEPEEAVGKLLIRSERLRSRMCGSHGVQPRVIGSADAIVSARSQRRQRWTSPSRVMMSRMGQQRSWRAALPSKAGAPRSTTGIHPGSSSGQAFARKRYGVCCLMRRSLRNRLMRLRLTLSGSCRKRASNAVSVGANIRAQTSAAWNGAPAMSSLEHYDAARCHPRQRPDGRGAAILC